MRIIAHIDMDAFFAAVEQRDNPSLKGKPVIVGADPKKGKGRGVVSTCSYEARKFGIRSAMPISQAYQRCPHGVYLRGSFQKYREASQQIFSIVSQFTPDIQKISIDEAFMDLTGCTHFYGSALKTCQAIKEQIWKEVGLASSIGVSPTKMVSKIASDYCKPNGLLEIHPNKVLEFLWPLPIEKLWGIGKTSQRSLNRLGIFKVKDLAQFSVKDLERIFGSRAQHYHRLANGIDERGVREREEAKSVSHEHTFEEDEGNLDILYANISWLAEKVSRRLRQYDLKGRTVSIKVRLSGFQTYTRAETLPERINFYEDIYQTSKKLFDVFFKQGMKIRLIGVRVNNFEDPYLNDSLFVDPKKEKREKLHQAVDTIKEKFGEKSITRYSTK